MIRNRLSFFARLSVIFALMMAMTGTAFAHRFDPPTDPALQEFLAAGGSLDDICGDDQSPLTAHVQTCDACNLVGSAMVPEIAAGLAPPFRVPARLVHSSDAPVHSGHIYDLSRAARAPPSV